jgi:ribosome recycling factor
LGLEIDSNIIKNKKSLIEMLKKLFSRCVTLPKTLSRNNISGGQLASPWLVSEPKFRLQSVQVYRSFAKQGKKQTEKDLKLAKKTQADVPTDLDFGPLQAQLDQEIASCKEMFSRMKVGRLTPEHFADIMVNAYGDQSPVSDLCQIITRGATTVALSIFDDSLFEPIRRSLMTTSYDFDIRKEDELLVVSLRNTQSKEVINGFLKEVKNKAEHVKKNLRGVRQKHMDSLREKKEFISKDVIFEAEKEIHSLYEKAAKDLEEIIKNKEKQITVA